MKSVLFAHRTHKTHKHTVCKRIVYKYLVYGYVNQLTFNGKKGMIELSLWRLVKIIFPGAGRRLKIAEQTILYI